MGKLCSLDTQGSNVIESPLCKVFPIASLPVAPQIGEVFEICEDIHSELKKRKYWYPVRLKQNINISNSI